MNPTFNQTFSGSGKGRKEKIRLKLGGSLRKVRGERIPENKIRN